MKWNGERAWSIVFRKYGEDNYLIRGFNHEEKTIELAIWKRPINFSEIQRFATNAEITKIVTYKELKKWNLLYSW